MAVVSVPRDPAKPRRNPIRAFVNDNRRAFSAGLILIIMLASFTLANPSVFTNPLTYRSVFVTLPVAIFLVVPLVFIITGGEIDLAFPATMGFSSWAFAIAVRDGWDPFAAMAVAVVLGLLLGSLIGMLVVYANLSSLIATIGMNFFLRGLINIGAQGFSIAIPDLRKTFMYSVFSGGANAAIPYQMFWALGFVLLGWFLYNRHRFGARVHCVGDNPDSSAEMGINVKRVRISLFMFVGVGAALAGVFSVLINFVWWPTTGDGFLLPALAAVFVGGTPAWGGVGTLVGGAVGSTIVSFIETGVIAAGLTGFYTQFFYGLIIILSLIGHRFNGRRYR